MGVGATATTWVVRSHGEHVVVCMAPACLRGAGTSTCIFALAREVRDESWKSNEMERIELVLYPCVMFHTQSTVFFQEDGITCGTNNFRGVYLAHRFPFQAFIRKPGFF